MAFGGFGAASQPSTGFGGFGAAAATSQPSTAFGGFGASAASSQPTTGVGGFGGFGAPAATSQPSTGFGGFGAATAQPSSAFGGFGAATSQPSTAFGGFGAATPQPSTGFGGFGAAATAQPSTGFGGFGAATATTSQPSTGFGGFGTTNQSSLGGTSFGGFGGTSTATGFGGFGSAAAAKPLGFGAPFGGASTTGFGGGATTTGFGGGGTVGFGGGGGTTGFGGGAGGGLFGGGANTGFGAGQQQQQLQQQSNPVDELFNAVLHSSLFGDERDGIIARLNMLQASWGVGKAYYSNSAQPVNLQPENPFCRFKAIGYSHLSKHDNKDGLVLLMFKKKLADIESGKQALLTSLTSVLGNKPNIRVNIESVRSTGPESTEVVVTVQESGQNGAVRKIPASEINSFFNQPAQAQNLKTLGVEMVFPKVSVGSAEIKEYLAKPPSGIDPRLWKQAQLDNPDSKKLMPVPIIGLKAVQQRIKAQEAQAKAHQGRLDSIAEDISELQKKHQETLSALTEAKRRQLELSHRILKVLVKQEATRKLGFTITPEEEQLRSQLEGLQSDLATPTQFKGRLNELLSQVRLQSQSSGLSSLEKYSMDQFAVSDFKSVLKDQQDGIQALVHLVKEDLKDLDTMVQGLSVAEAQ